MHISTPVPRFFAIYLFAFLARAYANLSVSAPIPNTQLNRGDSLTLRFRLSDPYIDVKKPSFMSLNVTVSGPMLGKTPYPSPIVTIQSILARDYCFNYFLDPKVFTVADRYNLYFDLESSNAGVEHIQVPFYLNAHQNGDSAYHPPLTQCTSQQYPATSGMDVSGGMSVWTWVATVGVTLVGTGLVYTGVA